MGLPYWIPYWSAIQSQDLSMRTLRVAELIRVFLQTWQNLTPRWQHKPDTILCEQQSSSVHIEVTQAYQTM